jgi:hypothetical protein
MKEIAFQKRNGVPVPFLPEDVDKWAEFKENQITRHKVTGSRKERSYLQLQMMHCLMEIVAENSENPSWNTEKKVKFSLKVSLHYVDEDSVVVDPRGNVHFQYRSFGYDGLDHMEACKIFDRAIPILASVIGLTPDELLNEGKRRQSETISKR